MVSIDQGFASLTIKGVSMEDSGKYTMIVQNKYGGESVDIVVSVSAVCHKLETDHLWHKSCLFVRTQQDRYFFAHFCLQILLIFFILLAVCPISLSPYRSVCTVMESKSQRPDRL